MYRPSAARLGAPLAFALLAACSLPAAVQSQGTGSEGIGIPPGAGTVAPAAGAAPAIELESGLEPGREVEMLAREARRQEEELTRRRARRDALVARLAELQRGSALERLFGAWERRRVRGRLAATVAELHLRQARLLELRARQEALIEEAAERAWERLESLVARGASSWREGRGEEPTLTPAIAAALERVGAQEPDFSVERYRTLVERLARVNAILEPGRPSERSNAARAGAARSGASARSRRRDPATGFLGVADRGAAFAPPRDASLAAWTSLRDQLADEIVATASEITRRALRSP